MLPLSVFTLFVNITHTAFNSIRADKSKFVSGLMLRWCEVRYKTQNSAMPIRIEHCESDPVAFVDTRNPKATIF